MPIIDILLLEGRDTDTKKRLLREVTEAVQRVLGSRPESIRAYVREVPPEQFSVGGVTKDELDAPGPR
jgi:4-oxalocrotonate tautomerase